MALSFDQITQLRAGIIDYAKQFDEEQLEREKIEGLLEFLSASTGEKVTKKDLGQITYHEYHNLDFGDSFMKRRPVWSSNRYIALEEESLDRIGRLNGKSVMEMTVEELTDTATRMFTITSKEYEALAREKGVELEDNYIGQYAEDSVLLLGLLKAKMGKFSREQIRQRILVTEDFGLGYFNGWFKGSFEYHSRERVSDNEISRLHYTFQQEWGESKKKLEQHLEADKRLRERHTLSAPTLLPDMTLELDIVPDAIDFAPDGNLVVLGERTDANTKDIDSTLMVLRVYDIKRGALIRSTNTNLFSELNELDEVSIFQGSLTAGQDGIIYVRGNAKEVSRYSLNLEEMRGNESNFRDAVELLRDQELMWNKNIFQVVQYEGIFYFLLQSDFDKRNNSTIVATDGRKIIGFPFEEYDPLGGSFNESENINPRIVISGNELYIKGEKQIVVVDRSCTEEAWKNYFIMIEPDNGINSSVHSNHCVSPAGVVYAVNKSKEEAAQSIKGYVRGKEKGEFATHIYPEDYPGGYAISRSMAINKEGILAYTSLAGNKVHFYQLER